jgi:bifunctional non-homologous end joining protein LigD
MLVQCSVSFTFYVANKLQRPRHDGRFQRCKAFVFVSGTWRKRFRLVQNGDSVKGAVSLTRQSGSMLSHDCVASEMAESSILITLDFIAPCLPCVTMQPPSGADWLHEIKHPGHRLIARRSDRGIRLFGENGEDWTASFPHLVEAMSLLPVKSCTVDGEVVRCDAHGQARLGPVQKGVLELGSSFYAFDVLEVNGFDLRRDRLEERKRVLRQVLRRVPVGIRLNEQFERCGESILRHISRMGFEGIVSKRLGSRYLSGRSPDWLFSRTLDDPDALRAGG